MVLDNIEYKRILPINNDIVSKYIFESYDIECDSSHGDFPIANKDYKKLCIDLYDTLHKAKESGKSEIFINKSLSKLCLKAAFDKDSQLALHEFDDRILINDIHTINNSKPSINQINDIHNYFLTDKYQKIFWDNKKRD